MFWALASDRPKCLTLPSAISWLDRARDVFHRHGRIDAVLLEEVDMVRPQPLQRTLDYLADLFRPAIEPDCLLLLVDLEPELRADENLVANGLQRLANQ